MSNLGDVLSKLVKLVYSNVSQTRVDVGAKHPAAGRFLYVFGKKSYFNAIGSHFAHVHTHLNELDFQYLKANQKNLIVQSSFYLQF